MSKLQMPDIAVSRPQQPGTYWDETTSGFGVRVGKNRKTWIVTLARYARLAPGTNGSNTFVDGVMA
jgi:hypothetical protein